MDMGLQGRTALVCAASKGLGRACAMALAREGVAVTITARTPGPLHQAAAEIQAATGVEVTALAGRRLGISGTGSAGTGSRRWMPTC